MDDLRVSKICADFHICVKYSLSQYADNSGELSDTAHPKLENLFTDMWQGPFWVNILEIQKASLTGD